MKHLLIAALVASTFLSPAAYAAVDLDLSAETGLLDAAHSASFRRGEGRDGAERLLRGGGERRTEQRQQQSQGQDQGRGNWRGNGGGNRSGWQQPARQPQPQAQPQRQAQPQAQPQPRAERWRGREGGVEQPRTEWRGGRENREVRDTGGTNDWRREDRGGNRGGWQQPQTQPQPEARPDSRTERSGESWRGAEGRTNDSRRNPSREDRGAGDWLRRHQDNDGNRRRDDNRRDDRYDNGWDRDRGGWDRDDNRRDDRYDNGWDRNGGRWDREDRRENRRDDRRWDRDGRDNNWRDNNRRDEHRWDNNWRNDNRYDWRGHRDRYRDHYRRPSHYYAPYRNHHYSRFSIGFYIGAPYYEQSYWLNDPWHYRLPPVHGPYRWVRYYDDVLLIDIRNGYVVDVIHDFFW